MSTVFETRPEKLYIGLMTEYPCPAHVHAVAEVIIQIQGYALVTIDEVQYRLTPGDAAVIFPLVPHSFDGLSEDSKGITAIFPPDIIPEYTGTFHGLQPECPLLPANRRSLDLRFAVERLSSLNMDDNLAMCIAYLHVILASLLHSFTYRPVYDYSEGGLGYRIISYITDHPGKRCPGAGYQHLPPVPLLFGTAAYELPRVYQRYPDREGPPDDAGPEPDPDGNLRRLRL